MAAWRGTFCWRSRRSRRFMRLKSLLMIPAAVAAVLITLPGGAQQTSKQKQAPKQAKQPIGVPIAPLGNGPFVLDTAEQHKIRVTVMTKSLSHPWAIAYLPDGGMLITERPG